MNKLKQLLTENSLLIFLLIATLLAFLFWGKYIHSQKENDMYVAFFFNFCQVVVLFLAGFMR